MDGIREYKITSGGDDICVAYPIDPELKKEYVEKKLLSQRRGSLKSVLDKTSRHISHVATLDSFDELKVEALEEPYQVPEVLMPFRRASHVIYDKTMFNGTNAVVDSPVRVPLRIRRGEYYDFKTTQLENVLGDLLFNILRGTPEDLFINTFVAAKTEERFLERYDPRLIDRFKAKTLAEFLAIRGFSYDSILIFEGKTIGQLLEENYDIFSKVFDIETGEIQGLQRATYPQGKTLEELMPELGIKNEERARYFAHAFIMRTNGGRELCLDQRGKKLGIAGDCISASGGTPAFKKEFFQQGFDFGGYHEDEVAKEMRQEYGLKKDEFVINRVHIFDDTRSLPYAAIEIITPLTTKQLAQRISEKNEPERQRAIDEHPILYGIRKENIRKVLRVFEVFPPMTFTISSIE